MTNLKIFQKLLTKFNPPSAQAEMKGQKQSTPLVDQGETPLSEKAPDALVERDPEEYEDSGYAPSKTTEVYRLVEREFLSPDFRHRNAHEDVDFDDFEEDAVADMILVGRVCEHFSRHLHLSTEERLRAEFLSKMKWLILTKASSQAKEDAGKENFMWHNLNTAFKIRQLEDANRGVTDEHKQCDSDAEKSTTGILDGDLESPENVSNSRKAFIPQLDKKMDVHGCSDNLTIQDLRLRLHPPTVPKKRPVGLDAMAFLGPAITPTKLLIRVVKGTVLFKFVAKKSNELSVSSGERVWFLAHYETVWLLAINSEGQIGLVPASFVEVSNHCKGSEISTRFDLAPVEEWNRKKWYWVIHCCMEDFDESETKGSVCPTDSDLPARDESENESRSSCSSMVPLFSNDNDWTETPKAETEQADCVDPNVGHEENHAKMESTNILSRFCGMIHRRERRKDRERHSRDTHGKEKSAQPPRGDPYRCKRDFWRRKCFSSNLKLIRQKASITNRNDLHNPTECHTDKSPDEKVNRKKKSEKCSLTRTCQPTETQTNRSFKGFVKKLNVLKLGGKRSSVKDTLGEPETPSELAPEVHYPTNHEAAQVDRATLKQIDRIGAEKTETEKHQVKPVWMLLGDRFKRFVRAKRELTGNWF